MNMKRYTIILASVLLIISSCKGLDDLNDRLSKLENRVQAIENILPTLNSNIEALMNLSNKNSITSVEEINGIYKIKLANGEIINLYPGSVGAANAPLMMIDKDGYWMVDYQDGNGYTYIKNNGQKVKAIGENGLTPRFGVSEEGYWTVSYNDGGNWVTVIDTNGAPVQAIPSEGADDYFSEVRIDDGFLAVVLKSGETLKFPIVPEFMFVINGSNEIHEFEAGELKIFTVVSSGIADAGVITKPAGWTVTLLQEQLIVTAPKAATKVTADTDTDITVLAIAHSGHSVMSKIRVKVK